MKLYILTMDAAYEQTDCDWDYNDSMVVCAEHAHEARQIANTHASAEGNIWSNPECSSCDELTPDTKGLILKSFNAG